MRVGKVRKMRYEDMGACDIEAGTCYQSFRVSTEERLMGGEKRIVRREQEV
jgi:hypothetical protein